MSVVLAAVLGTTSCLGRDRPAPTTAGLRPEQIRSALFLEKDAVLDLRRRDESRSSAAGFELQRFELGDGWFVAETSGRWATGARSDVSVYVAEPDGLSLYLESQGTEAESVQVILNGSRVGLVRPTPEWTPHLFPLEAELLRRGLNRIEFVFEFPPDRPAFQTRPGDPATLIGEMIGSRPPSVASLRETLPAIRQVFPGASIQGEDILNLPGLDVADVIGNLDSDGAGTDWQWVSLGGGALSAGFRTIALVENPESFQPETRGPGFSRDRGGLTIESSGRVFIPFAIEGSGRTATIVASTQAGWGRTTDLQVALTFDDTNDLLAEEQLGGWWGRAEYAGEASLDGASGPACLVLDADLAPRSGPLALNAIELVADPLPPAVLTPLAEPAPDIVLIILDAARADHFGCYGYERDTSPNVDRLAAESLVFGQAFATSPYTACSMPTMLTGWSFLDHRVVRRGQVLDESITTLAESLQDRGYRTSCYSANPNNGINRGLGQGCDRFEELWRGQRRVNSRDPYLMSSLALDRLDDPTDGPEFLMLHYVPPHEPYTPRPEFDLFRDDRYAGSYDGTVDTLRGINRGELRPTRADLDEIIGLYDGNLLTGDDAVGQVLDRLRQRDQWDRTVVLVTSDHGEAFLEHGRMAHSSTVYDEMLRVPFVLRLPGGVVPEHIDTDRLVTLEDVVPTLLGLAGVQPTAGLPGVNLLQPETLPRRRGFVIRSGQSPPFAYRTPRWKLVEGLRAGRVTRELYDVTADPAESENVYLENLERAACLQSLLRLELSTPRLGATAGDGAELDAEELNSLRALGYVR